MALERQAEISATTPARILIVDDKPANLVALEAVLEPLHRPIVRASSGEGALRHLLEGEFAVILMDVVMPGLDGIQTASLIRERDRTRHIPIIFITAEQGEVESIRQAYALGGVDYILKPFDPLILRSKVGAFVTLHEQADALRRHERALASEAERRMAAELAAREKDLFLGVLGHDLRTPLGSLQIGVALLKQSLGDAHQPLLVRMERSVQRMERMLHDVLDSTRISVGGGIKVRPTPCDLRARVEEVLDELRLSHAGRVITITIVGPLEASCDDGRIGQLVANLVGNALKHSAADPVRVELDGTDPRHVRLVVANPGEIAEPILPRLFEPFRRADTHRDGLGLGLYIVRAIAEAHGGTIEVAVDRPQGETRFIFTLPRTPPAGSSPGATA